MRRRKSRGCWKATNIAICFFNIDRSSATLPRKSSNPVELINNIPIWRAILDVLRWLGCNKCFEAWKRRGGQIPSSVFGNVLTY